MPAQNISVYEVWWVTTHFPASVAAGASSRPQRTVPDTGYAYALLAPDFDPSSRAIPDSLVAVRSREPLQSKRGETLHIVMSDENFIGNCAAGSYLSKEDAELIVKSIFPGPFRGRAYDLETCSVQPMNDPGVAPDDDAASGP